jgi:transcriptional regulator with XRE-family HTH domain
MPRTDPLPRPPLAVDPTLPVFAHRLREARVLRLLSREALARTSGVPASSIGRFERGAGEPSASALQRLAAALRVTPDALLGAGLDELDPRLAGLFDELRRARPEQQQMVLEFWEFLRRKETGGP